MPEHFVGLFEQCLVQPLPRVRLDELLPFTMARRQVAFLLSRPVLDILESDSYERRLSVDLRDDDPGHRCQH